MRSTERRSSSIAAYGSNMQKERDDRAILPGAIWGGWWGWEPPPEVEKEDPEVTAERIERSEEQAGVWHG
jgi:hypothetical protein